MRKDQQLYFDLVNELVVPFVFGNGKYEFILYENVAGGRYIIKQRKTIQVKLEDILAYQLSSNSFVTYDTTSAFYNLALQLKTIDNIYNYIIKNISYDYIKAINTKQQYPEIDKCFEQKRGICYDIAALMVAMCRICGFHAALIIGYCDKVYHAWVNVEGKNYDPTKRIIGDNKKHKYTTERKY